MPHLALIQTGDSLLTVVYHDGLVPESQLAHEFDADAREVVKTGDFVKVQAVEMDLARKRMALTMKLGTPAQRTGESGRVGDDGYQA